MIGTGRWMAKAHCQENLCTLARQYPKGILSTNTKLETIIIRIINAKLKINISN